jgi:hypothetical protein
MTDPTLNPNVHDLRSSAEVTLEQAERANHELGIALAAGSADTAGLLGTAAVASGIAAREAGKYAATPAPLDPSKVKVGDTVTVRVEEFDIPDPYEVTGKAYVGPIGMAVGGFLLGGDRVTLTDHQPAPEPEREPGTSGTATVEGKAGVQGTWVRSLNGEDYFATHHAETSTGNLAHSDQVTDFVPDEPRPLPARDELAKAITRGTRRSADDHAIIHKVNGHAAADRVLDLLGGAR